MSEEKELRPVTEEERQANDMMEKGPTWTICETLREVYRLAFKIEKSLVASSNDKAKAREIMERSRTAVAMAKRMNVKLKKYKFDYDEGWWSLK